jgi:hypothetical protein
MPADVFFQVIEEASVEHRLINIIEGEDWWAPIMAYLHHHYDLDRINEQIRMQQWAKAYQIIDNNLYKAKAHHQTPRSLAEKTSDKKEVTPKNARGSKDLRRKKRQPQKRQGAQKTSNEK